MLLKKEKGEYGSLRDKFLGELKEELLMEDFKIYDKQLRDKLKRMVEKGLL